jgi:hypothetical protein
MFKPLSSLSNRVANLIIPQQNRTGIEDWYHKSRCVAPMNRYLAHVRQDKDGSFVIHNLEEHLRAVADLAGEFAAAFGHADWGRLAGLWHTSRNTPRFSKAISSAGTR